MAMNKKEREAFEEAQREAVDGIRLARALRWSDGGEKPDLSPDRAGSTIFGYSANAYSGTVSPAWSTAITHGWFVLGSDKMLGASQGGRRLYSTKLRALRGLRAEMELVFARRLADVDAQIAEAVAEEAGGKS